MLARLCWGIASAEYTDCSGQNQGESALLMLVFSGGHSTTHMIFLFKDWTGKVPAHVSGSPCTQIVDLVRSCIVSLHKALKTVVRIKLQRPVSFRMCARWDSNCSKGAMGEEETRYSKIGAC